MFLNQPVTCFFKVIEIIPFPGTCAVARFAFFAKFPFMIIVFHMAIVTDRRGIFKNRGLMTKGAFHRFMFASQRERGLLMVKPVNVFP